MAEESGRPVTCRSKVGCEAIDEPCTNRIVPMLFAGSPAHFSNMNSFTPPSLVVQCSSPLIGGLVISFIAHLCDFRMPTLSILFLRSELRCNPSDMGLLLKKSH